MKTDREQTYSMDFENGLYIGDPCYLLDDDFYRKVWEQKYNFAEGNIEDKMVVYLTEFGDGQIRFGHRSPQCRLDVDSGNIAFIPMGQDICSHDLKFALMQCIIQGKGYFSVYRKDGVLYAHIVQESDFEISLK